MILKFSRDFIKTCVQYKICNDTVLRDYDILKSHKEGMSLGMLSIKYSMSVRQIFNIVHKYK